MDNIICSRCKAGRDRCGIVGYAGKQFRLCANCEEDFKEWMKG